MKDAIYGGVNAAVLTAMGPDLTPDLDRMAAHAKWLLGNGCNGLGVLGTTGEANSFGLHERKAILEGLIARGIPAARMMPGTGCASLTDSVELTKHARDAGCPGVLMLPPFYYKGVSDEGLFRNFAEVIERVGDERLALYLYHIPPVAQVPITLGLIEKLLAKYPSVVAGVKDSSGDWANTKAMLDNYAKSGFDVFAGSEVFLLDNMRNGGKGCITATGNINPGAIADVYRNWRSAEADKLQAGITATRKIVQKQPMIPALKSAVAHFGNDPQWKTVRPPLVELSSSQEETLIKELRASGFTMPGLV